MRQFHIKIIVLVALTIIGATRAQDDTTPENKDELKLENQNLEDDNLILVDEAEIRVTESSGDDDLDPNLKVLAINENEPPEVPEKSDIADASAPIEIKVIADDEISRLSLETIGEGNWSELKSLSIENNKIEKIDKEIFEKLPKLTKLSLKGNLLKNVETETFSEATNLSELNLDNNPLELPEEAHFLTTSSLRKFSMSECGLKMIKEDTFIGMTGLEELDIGKNQINEVTPITKELFEPLSNLTKLIIPLGSSEILMNAVCKTHGLLQKICLDECDTANDHSCTNQETNDGEPKIISRFGLEASSEAQPPASESTEKSTETTEKSVETTEKSVETTEKSVETTEKSAVTTDKISMSTENIPDSPMLVKTAEETDKTPKTGDETSDKSTNEMGIVPSPNVKKVDRVEQSTSDVTSQSPNGAAIGAIIGVIIIIITGIIVKKNWSKIKSIWSSDERSTPAPKTGQNVDRIRIPEEVPLKANNEVDNPV